MFCFLPLNNSSYEELNAVRESIKTQLAEEYIVPSESCMKQKFFRKPREVGRLMPRFWNILERAEDQGVRLNLFHDGIYALNSSFDREEYDQVLEFLGVGTVNNEWYAKCIQSSNMVLGVSENVYLELLLFLAENWTSEFCNTNIFTTPLIKYVDQYGKLALCSINESTRSRNRRAVCLSDPSRHQSWLIDWNREFRCVADLFFMPESTNDAVQSCSKKELVLEWLRDEVKVVRMTAYDYTEVLINHLTHDPHLVVAYAHFLYHSFSKQYLSSREVDRLCSPMPLVDNYRNVCTTRNGILVPAKGSKWVELFDSNPWRKEGYIELWEDYLRPGNFAGQGTPGKDFINFLNASDIPYISPPNVDIPSFSDPLTKENAFLLLDWIRNLKHKGIHIPEKLLTCIKAGSWMAITVKGTCSYRPPSETFFLTSSLGNILQEGSVLVDIPLVDQKYYDENINKYEEELKTIGVMFEHKQACEFIGKRLLSSIAPFNFSKDDVFSVLNFIKYLREKYLPLDSFIPIIKEGSRLKTSRGYMSPGRSVLYDQEWEVASKISDIPFIDQNEYGEKIFCFKMELQLLGVIVDFDQNFQVVIDYLKLPSTSPSVEAVLLVLACLRHSGSSDKLVELLRDAKWFKTNAGYMTPGESLLFDFKWESYLKQTDGPFIDEEFYGPEIKSFRTELNAIGVNVDIEKACTLLARHLDFHTEFATIVRIYNFLAEFKWVDDSEAARMIWIPDGSENGRWVSRGDCVLHDKDGLFGSQLNVLEKHYERELLSFFSRAFTVKSNPSVDDYCKLWKVWEKSGQEVSDAECCAFWDCVVNRLNSKTDQKLLADSFTKLPVNSGSDGILLFDKRDVFITDDLHLKHLFVKSSPQPIFVWYPQSTSRSLPWTKLLELYRKIGVRTISESVQKEELSLGEDLELRQVNQQDFSIGKGLVKLILGFLADPSIQFEPAKRHEAVRSVLNLTIRETAEPLRVRYNLSLSSGECVEEIANQVMRWDRESGKLFTQNIDRSGGNRELVKYATQFSDTISKGILWEREDYTNALSELIKLGFLLEFEEEVVEFLMESKNLQIFMEDEKFLSDAFPSE